MSSKFKFFGEYLVKENIITNEILVQILIEQIESIPSFAKVAWEQKIFSPEEFMLIFNEQQSTQRDFLSCSKKLNLLNEDKEYHLKDIIEKQRPALGQLLVSKGIVDFAKLNSCLDDFLSQKEVDKIVVVEKINNDNIENFKSNFDERKFRLLKVTLSLIKENTKNDIAMISKLFLDMVKIIKSIAGACSLIDVNRSKKIFILLENAILKFVNTKKIEHLILSLNDKIAILSEVITFSWDIRMYIVEHGEEDSFFVLENNNIKYSEILASLEGCINEA